MACRVTGNSKTAAVPEISRFYGIVITMYALDHPPPHFHARYAEHQAMISIADCRVIVGEMPARVLRLIRDWVGLHMAELHEDWELAQAGEEVRPIPPLP